jgi:hypothetical protein
MPAQRLKKSCSISCTVISAAFNSLKAMQGYILRRMARLLRATGNYDET